MALGTQRVNLQFRGGIDSKTNDQLVIPSKLVRAENVEFDADTVQRRKALQARSGTTAGELGYMPVRMFTHGNSLIVEDQYGTHRRVGGAEFDNSQMRVAAEVTRHGEVAGVNTSGAFDSAVDPSGNVLIAREEKADGDSAFSVRWEIHDSQGLLLLQGKYGGGVNVVKPVVRYSTTKGNFLMWVVNEASSTSALVQRLEINVSTGVVGLVTDITAVVSSNKYYNLCFDVDLRTFTASGGGECYGVVACELLATTPTLYGRVFNLTSNTQVYAASTTGAATTDMYFLSVYAGDAVDGTGTSLALLMFYSKHGSGNVYRRIIGTSGAWGGELTTLTQSGQVGRIVLAALSTTKLILACDYSTTAVGIRQPDTQVLQVPCDVSAAAAEWAVLARSRAALTTKLFSVRGGLALGVTFCSQQYQSVFLLVNIAAVIAQSSAGLYTTAVEAPVFGRFDWGETAPISLSIGAGTENEITQPAQALQVSVDDIRVPYVSWLTNTLLVGGDNETSKVLSYAKLDPRSQLGDVTWNGTVLLAGALPLLCDGQSIVEEGLHFNPEITGSVTAGTVILTPNNTGNFALPEAGKTYTVAFTLSWRDAQGNSYESGVAYYGQVTTTVGNQRFTPNLVLPTTAKSGVRLCFYRSLGNATDTTLYLSEVRQISAGAVVGVGSTTTDANLISSEVLYTEGGVLPNTPCPPCRHLETYQDRIVASGNGQKVFFSKTRSLGFGAEFVSDQLAFQLNAPADYGRVVGTATEGDTLLVFGESVIGIVYGAGPDNTGVGNFQSVTEIIHDRGALWESPKSIKQTREGVWFHSRDGLRLVAGNTLAVANNMEVGAEFDSQIPGEFNGYLPRVVTLSEPTVGGLPQTRFVFTYLWEAGNAADAGAYLASWHSMWSQFTAFTNHIAVDAETAMVSGRSAYHLLSYDGSDSAVVRYRSETQSPSDAWVDGTTSDFASLVRTSWIQFAGVQGYQRAKRLLLLGRVLEISGGSTMDYELNLRYDFDDDEASFVQEFAVSGAALVNTFQFWHQIGRQKCEALQAEFVWTPRTSPSTLRLTDMAMDIGVKGTFRKATKL